MKFHFPINNRFISNSIKIIVSTLGIGYIFYQFQKAMNDPEFSGINLSAIADFDFYFLMFLAIVLVFVNWGIEALKWRILIEKYERISFKQAFKGVMTGVAFGIFTPNRIGEVGGRVFFLKKANKIKAAIISVIGGMAQLYVTILLGGVSLFFFLKYHSHQKESAFIQPYMGLVLCFIALSAFSFIFFIQPQFLHRIVSKFVPGLSKYSMAFTYYSASKLLLIFLLSFVRYMVFAVQFILVLLALKFDAESGSMLMMVALTYFVSTILPSFAFTEIATRGSAAVYFFSFLENKPMVVLVASFVIWVFNLALPALVGVGFMSGIKINKK